MKPTEIAAVLDAHELTIVQAVRPFRTLWRCKSGADCFERDATTIPLSAAQHRHQAQKLAVVLRREARSR